MPIPHHQQTSRCRHLRAEFIVSTRSGHRPGKIGASLSPGAQARPRTRSRLVPDKAEGRRSEGVSVRVNQITTFERALIHDMALCVSTGTLTHRCAPRTRSCRTSQPTAGHSSRRDQRAHPKSAGGRSWKTWSARSRRPFRHALPLHSSVSAVLDGPNCALVAIANGLASSRAGRGRPSPIGSASAPPEAHAVEAKAGHRESAAAIRLHPYFTGVTATTGRKHRRRGPGP